MASQSQIEDEILAQRLQEEEYAEQRRQQQLRQDQALARQMSQSSNQYAIQAGQSVVVRLHHPRTTRQIGEVLYAHYIQQNLMQFELANMRGKYLRATSSGTVEFTSSNDDKCKFYIEPAPNGTMYLLNKNYAGRSNVNNQPGWYLSMSFDGQLSSNGYKCELSQWALVAAAPPPGASPQPMASPPPPAYAPTAAAPAPAPAPRPAAPASPPQAAAVPPPAPPAAAALPPPGGEVEMEEVTNFQFNPLFANRPPPAAEPTAVNRSSATAAATASSATTNTAVTAGAVAAAAPVIASQHTGTVAATAAHPTAAAVVVGQPPAPVMAQHPAVIPVQAVAPTRPPLVQQHSTASAALMFPGHDAGRDALMRFFLSPEGITFLQQPQYADAFVLYNAGTLGRILHRPDWPLLARRFVDLVKQPYPALDVAAADAALPFNEGKAFFDEGYCVARGVVPQAMVDMTLKLAGFWLSRNALPTSAAEATNLRKYKNRVELCGAITGDFDLLNLFYGTPLVQIVQQFIGSGDVRPPSSVSVIHTFPSLEIPVDFSKADATMLTNSGDKWVIEGFDGKGGHSPYNILIGVALTDMTAPFMGNFTVFPGSHMLLMEAFKEQVVHKSTLYSEDPNLFKKIDLGEPKQLSLRAGDAVLMTQRLAHYYSFNNGIHPSTMAFLRISHVDHEVLRDPALDGVWLEFRGTEKYLEVKTDSGAGATSVSGPAAAPPATAGSSSAAVDFLNDVQGLQINPSSTNGAAVPTAAPSNYWDSVPNAAEPLPVAQPYTPQMD